MGGEAHYRRTRHPIYLAFDLIFLGSFLTLGRPIFLLRAAIWIPIIHRLMLREERFLGQRYGDAYLDYANRVRRYF